MTETQKTMLAPDERPPADEWKSIMSALEQVRHRFRLAVDGKEISPVGSLELGYIFEAGSLTEIRWDASARKYRVVAQEYDLSEAGHTLPVETDFAEFASGDPALAQMLVTAFWSAIIAQTLPRMYQPAPLEIA